MYTARIEPALASNVLTIDDLIELLRSVEGVGRQHIFLYKCDPTVAVKLMDRSYVEAQLKVIGASHLYEIGPMVLDQPDEPTLVDVTWTSAAVDLSLTIKEVEQRVTQKLGETSYSSNSIVKTYVLQKTRVVNVVRLHRDGLLEVRLASHSGTTYLPDIARLWKQIEQIIPRNLFQPVHLSKAKGKLFKDKKELEHKIRFSDSLLRNDEGITLRAGSGSINTDLTNSTGATESMETFMQYDDAYCDGLNIRFKVVDGIPSRETRVLLTGENHEFAVTSNCSQADYEYILRELRVLNS